MAYPENLLSPNLTDSLAHLKVLKPIIPFENLPLSFQIFLALTSLFILIGSAHIVWKMIRSMLNKKD